MRKTKVRELSIEEFQPYGTYASLIDPSSEKIGAPPIEFFRDMVQQNLGGADLVSFSACRVENRDLIVDTTEYHTRASEGILPIDNDILIHVAPATPSDGCIPLDKIAVFRVPQGTMVVIRPGVWHHAPFTTNAQAASVLIVLPERTYANDCEVFEIKGEDRIRIEP